MYDDGENEFLYAMVASQLTKNILVTLLEVEEPVR